MNEQNIEKLFDTLYAQVYLAKHIDAKMQTEMDFSDLTITPIKRTIREHFYHIVVQFDSVSFHEKPIFLSAHSHEDRSNALRALQFIAQQKSKNNSLWMPQPLFYEESLKAFAYRGLAGKSFLQYAKQATVDLTQYIKHTAEWIAFLHETDTTAVENFNPENSRIETTVPGPAHYLPKIQKNFPEQYPLMKEILDKLIAFEKNNLNSLDRMYLIHGDFHPENVIIGNDTQTLSVIDFTDICLSDWARDIGSFIQQIGFMIQGSRSTEAIQEMQNQFLTHYATIRSLTLDNETEKRIMLYKAWAALRSAIYFFSKKDSEPREGKHVLNEAHAIVSEYYDR